MKNLKSSSLAKILAFILILAFAAVMFISFMGVGVLYSYGGYSGSSLEGVLRNYLEPWCVNKMLNNMEGYRYGADPEELDSTIGMTFTIYDQNKKVVYDGLGSKSYMLKTSPYGFWYPAEDSAAYNAWMWEEEESREGIAPEISASTEPQTAAVQAEDAQSSPQPTEAVEEEPQPTAAPEENETTLRGSMSSPQSTAAAQTPEPSASPAATAAAQTQEPAASPVTTAEPNQSAYVEAAPVPVRYSMVGYVLDTVTENSEVATMTRIISVCFAYSNLLLGVMVASALLALACFAFLMAAAGHRKGCEEIQPGITERLPFDVLTVLVATAGVILMQLLIGFSYGDANAAKLVAYVLIFEAGAALCLWWCMSFARRLKMGNVIKSCISIRLLLWCWRVFKKLMDFVGRTLKGMALIPRASVIIFGILFIEFFWIVGFGADGAVLVFGWFIERAVLVLLTLYVLLCMKKLLKAGKEISQGNMDYHVDTGKMYGPLKEHGEQLNRISEGMNKAVNARMKSEHFKTELITNVSHDIKTPLTSIINYVDLLEKEEIDNEKAKEYIQVLSRQSARLKKLIDDLIEASKASTGNLNVNLERCELGVLIDQSAGEYAEKLKAAGLELVITKPEEPVVIMADGRHMWRVFDNLLNNVCKYAMAGTRVYLNLDKAAGKATVTFRNISASQLNISGEELMERFVRGDSSRNTEGSGLGLSIARSLVQLQNGELELTVDGDLFKVVLRFKAID